MRNAGTGPAFRSINGAPDLARPSRVALGRS